MRELQETSFIQYLHRHDAVALEPEDPQALAKDLNLQEKDLTPKVASERILDISDMAKLLFAANRIRKFGKKKHIIQAERAEKLCQLHPEFGVEAKAILARHALMLGDL